MTQLFYYGVEQMWWEPTGLFPRYQKGLYVHNLTADEDVEEVRETIEKRCKANPDASFMGIITPHFNWLN